MRPTLPAPPIRPGPRPEPFDILTESGNWRDEDLEELGIGTFYRENGTCFWAYRSSSPIYVHYVPGVRAGTAAHAPRGPDQTGSVSGAI